ncbi:hypothetical protein RHSIM_Rhsim05G0033100 [Rhododendron simsii]|uniref:Leucine-rich repeat-containing N-terminal plant-type domain-containing protein n=1 Tax=Rhododendron simsii TaxID=118357 RepID=A0A834GWV0_RHOSS|nr:hypothetical protein RHSIM_Rhsim05G0033100 [Rhododendron simsii]
MLPSIFTSTIATKLMTLILSSLLIHRIKLLSLVLFFTTATQVACKLSNETDRLALFSFKELIDEDPLSSLSFWNSSLDLCKWDGVTCSHKHRRVVILDLRGKSLRGTMSPFLGNLTFLRSLYLQENKFQGKIPLELNRLFRLRRLNFSFNSLQEEIPTNLSNSLSVIDLWSNDLVGKIPASFGSLSKLAYLDLFSNNLIGGIPPSLGNLSLLQRIDLGENRLTGTIPHSIGRLSNLKVFAVGGNKLSGTVPPTLYNISTLMQLLVINNQLTGSLPQDIGLRLTNLILFSIAQNQFWGPIPASLFNASRMKYLVLSNNNFSGAVPFDLGRKMKDLIYLNLGENNLGSGDASDLSFIDSLTNCSKLQTFGFYANGFGGVLPTSIANLSSHLKFLGAGWNQLVGTIPVGISNFVNLDTLGLQGNLFSGVIPFEIGKLRNLELVSFSTNKLSGPIPESIGNLTRIFGLDLEGNNLNGTIPSSIENILGLQTLDLAHNFLTEYGIGERTSTEGDVYSYGILLLEMVTGKRPIDELFTIRQSLHEFCKVALPERVMEIVDSRMLLEEPTEAKNDAQKERVRRDKIRECSISLVRIGISCSVESPRERMNIKDVIIGLMKIKEVFLGVGIHGRRQMRMRLIGEGTSQE